VFHKLHTNKRIDAQFISRPAAGVRAECDTGYRTNRP